MPNPSDTDPAVFADKLARLGETDRFWRINRAELIWHGHAHEGRPSFWDGNIPLRDRAPAVQSMLVRTAGRRLVSLVFGERAFPSIGVSGSAFGARLTDADRTALSALIDEIVRVATLRRRMREVMTDGLRAGTTVALQSIRAGRPTVDIIPAKWCRPTFGDDGVTLTKLVIEYKFPRDGKWFVHRREITPPTDTTYEPVECSRGEHAPINWTTTPVAYSAPCAFVPAAWHRNAVESIETSHDIDGHPLCSGVEDELSALDLELSQLYRNALYNGDPQMVRIGAEPEDDVLPRGVTAGDGGYGRSRLDQRPAIAKGPGNLWDLATGSDAKMVESTGAGAQIIEKAIDHLRRVIVDAMGVVLADPAQLGTGELSARALSLLMAPMLGTADDLRVEYGDTLCTIVDQLLRLCAMTPGAIYLAGLEPARNALNALFARTSTGSVEWMRAPLELTWGDYFEPSWPEVSAALDAARKANGDQPVMTLEESRALVAPVLGLKGNADAVRIEQQGWVDATARVLGGAPTPDASATAAPVAADGAPVESVADTALNGAQTDGLIKILASVGDGTLPTDTAREVILAAFPSIDAARVERMLAPIRVAPVASNTGDKAS